MNPSGRAGTERHVMAAPHQKKSVAMPGNPQRSKRSTWIRHVPGNRLPGTFPFLLLCLGLFLSRAQAHEPTKSYLSLSLETNRITGQWDIPLGGLQTAFHFPTDTAGVVSWKEFRAHYTNVTAYALTHLRIGIDGRPAAIHLGGSEPVVEEFPDGVYVEIPFTLESGSRPKTVSIDYELFFDFNSLHRGLVRLDAGGQTQTAIFSPDQRAQTFAIGGASPGGQFLAFVHEGMLHIWTGYDHILFLLALLLPSVLRREAGQWRGVPALRPAFMNILKIVTAFTIAHSLTLGLAAFQVVKLPARVTESAIALSVGLAAANNLWPVILERGWLVAFVFGLIHGFGFANALAGLGLARGNFLPPLVGFNLGVEAGQLALVALFLPLAFTLRRSWLYQNPFLRLGSVFILLVAGGWLLERVFDFTLMPF